MKTFFQGSFVGLALFFFGRQGLAQTDNLRFEHLSTADGLSNNSLRDICQDRDGFLWFGTLDGLNKYDGYNFTIFKFDPNEPDHSLQNSVPKDIYEDSTGRLWVATLGGGLNEVEKNTGKIIPYGIPPIRTNNWNVLLTIYEERPGILWLGAVPGILRFDLQTKKYTKYPLPIATNVGGMDAAGRLWVISRSGVFYLNSKNGDFTPIPLNAPSGNPSFFTAIHLDAAGVLWVGTDANGLFRLDTKVNPLQLIPYNPKGQINQSLNNYAQGIYEDAEGFLWLATTQGLQRVDKKTNQVVTYRSDPSRPGSLSSNNVHSVFKDREGTLWVGTDNGINKAVARPKLFETHKIIHPPTRVHLAENDIQAILEDRDGTVWLGSPKGLYRMDRSRKHIKPISDAKASERFSREGVEALYEDHLGRLWVGTNQALYQLVTGKENFVRYPTQSPIQFLAEDAKGNLWLGGFLRNSGAIFSFNPVTEKFHYYPAESAPDETVTKNTILGTWRLFDLTVSRTGDVWAVGTGPINRFNPGTGKFAYYNSTGSTEEVNLNDQTVLSIYEDLEGIFWLGTAESGLYRFNPDTKDLARFTTREGLPSNRVTSVTADEHGNLWLGTSQGLSRFDPRRTMFRNFDMIDGLPDNEFNVGSIEESNGRILLGSRNGFVIFHPDSIMDNTTIPPVHLTGLKVLEERRAIPADQLALPYYENFLSFDFVALNYDSPEKNQYAYQLIGVDKGWIHSATRRYASYTNLDPGKYTFRVKASNNDGFWNEQGASLSILILPPWWHTWWAYAVYSLGVVSSLFAINRFNRARLLARERDRTRERELAQAGEIEKAYQELKSTQAQLIEQEKKEALYKEQLKIQQVRNKIASELHDDIGSTLSSIHLFSEVAKKKIKQDSLDALPMLEKIESSSQEMMQSMNEIVWAIHSKNDDTILFFDKIHRFANQILSTRNIEFRVEYPARFHSLPMDMELRRNIYLICKETFNNIAKHSHATVVNMAVAVEEKNILIGIRDNGRGFDCRQPSLGNGLFNLNSRAEMIGGQLQIDSSPGKGTLIHLQCRLT